MTTSLNSFVKMAHSAKRVVVCRSIAYADDTAVKAYENLRLAFPSSVFLEFSPSPIESYSFLGLEPMAELLAKKGVITQRIEDKLECLSGDPFIHLRQMRELLSCADDHPLSQLAGGAVGYLAYDAIRYIEALPPHEQTDENIADIDLKFYKTSIIFDHINKEGIIAVIVKVDKKDMEQTYQNAISKIESIFEKLSLNKKTFSTNLPIPEQREFCADVSDENYELIVKKAKNYISKGDAFQIVCSRRFSKAYHQDPFLVFKALKKISPSPYHFYFNTEKFDFTGASPEKVVSVKEDIIEIVPLAGTRKRQNNENDEEIINELIKNEKEIAEHMMLVDLARNDVGHTAKPGSVVVKELLKPVSFSHVIHITSTVQGKLDKNKDVIDVLKTTFPAGTLTGAPKIRAMEIIDELELSPRGLYGGAVIALDRKDNLHTCIIIRSALIKNNIVEVRSGAGIVQDSDPIAEANETRDKASSVIAAIQLVESGKII